MARSTPDSGDHSSGDSRPKRTVITAAEMLGTRSGRLSRGKAGQAGEPGCPLYAAAARHKSMVTSGVLVAVGSLVATAALFGHVDRAGVGEHPPAPRHPGGGVPGADMPAELPGRNRETVPGAQVMRDLTTVALPTLSELTVPSRPARARGVGRAVRDTGAVPASGSTRRGADDSTRSSAGPVEHVAGFVGGTVEAVGDKLGSEGESSSSTPRGARHAAVDSERGSGRSIGSLSGVGHRVGKHSAPGSDVGAVVRSIGALG